MHTIGERERDKKRGFVFYSNFNQVVGGDLDALAKSAGCYNPPVAIE